MNEIKKTRYLLALIVALLFSSLPAAAGENPLAPADSAYEAGNYSGAIQLYQGVLNKEGTSAAALFNLGNAYYQAGDLGNARICYERARRLDPSAKEINNNLNYLVSKVEDANRADLSDKKLSVTPGEKSFFDSLHQYIALDLSTNSWARMAAMAFILLLACVALYLFPRNVALRKVGFFGGGIFAMFSIVFIIFAFIGARAVERHDTGVVMAFKTPLLTEPQLDSKAATSPLHRGTKLQILAEEEGPDGEAAWFKVRLNDDFVGWIPGRDFTVI